MPNKGKALLKRLPIAGEVFTVAERNAFLIMPKSAAPEDVPWVWYAPTFPQHPDQETWIFEQLLARGIAIAGIDVGESYGSREGRKQYSALYKELVKNRGLSKTPCLLARSRGGLMLYNWAAENPKCVSGIAGIYPVCNLASYPGLDKACSAYGMDEESLAKVLKKHNPIDRLEPIAKARVPIFHIHGDNDRVVPLEQNSSIVAERYKALGGTMTLKVVTGGGHDCSPHWFRDQELVDFMIRCVLGESASVEDLDGAAGKIFKVDAKKKRFELLKETVIDPKTNEGRSRHSISWNDKTRFITMQRQNDFKDLTKPALARVKRLGDADPGAATTDEPYIIMEITLLAGNEALADWAADDAFVVGRFTPDPSSDKLRGGTLEVDGKQIPLRLRGPRAEVTVRSEARAKDITNGFWKTTIRGGYSDGGFIAEKIDISPLADPRETDDPKLPRVLVVGDSISMNYHRGAKEALAGVANYYRVSGNAGPSDRGVVCMELWLGDYKQKGLHWDLIQFNHGLHDLKQLYSEETKTYTDYQIPLEQYKANLEQEIQIMKKTGATLMWCPTTPVPNSSVGVWGGVTMGRRKDEDLAFNKAAMEVISKHPEILVNDINAYIRNTEAFDKWREQKDVHFWGRTEADLVGKAVAEGIKKALGHEGREHPTTNIQHRTSK